MNAKTHKKIVAMADLTLAEFEKRLTTIPSKDLAVAAAILLDKAEQYRPKGKKRGARGKRG